MEVFRRYFYDETTVVGCAIRIVQAVFPHINIVQRWLSPAYDGGAFITRPGVTAEQARGMFEQLPGLICERLTGLTVEFRRARLARWLKRPSPTQSVAALDRASRSTPSASPGSAAT